MGNDLIKIAVTKGAGVTPADQGAFVQLDMAIAEHEVDGLDFFVERMPAACVSHISAASASGQAVRENWFQAGLFIRQTDRPTIGGADRVQSTSIADPG